MNENSETPRGSVRVEHAGPIAHVVLSNPARYNAMSLGMWRALAETLERLDTEPEVRVIALRGDGSRAFVAGADISEFETQRADPRGVASYDEAVAHAQDTLANTAKPTV